MKIRCEKTRIRCENTLINYNALDVVVCDSVEIRMDSASAVHPCMLGFQNSLESSLADVYKREAARATLHDAVEEGHAPLTQLEDVFKAAREELRSK